MEWLVATRRSVSSAAFLVGRLDATNGSVLLRHGLVMLSLTVPLP